MKPRPVGGASLQLAALRKWAIRVAVVLLVVEVVYVLGANALLRTETFADLVNRKPEKTKVTWESAATYFPGFVKVRSFELRSQTKKDQAYLRVAEASGRISLLKLIFKTIHIRGVDAADVDFRYRERLDRPPKPGEEEARKPPEYVEFFPEIPGLTNPPDPKPEELYPRKRKKRPWTITITGAEVEGPIKVALNAARLEGDGWVGGGVTVKPRKTVEIHRARLEIPAATMRFGPELVTEDLVINADLRIKTFPARGAKPAEVLSGISGELALGGTFSERAAVSQQITPGITTFGAGHIAANLKLDKGVLRAGSEYSLRSEAFLARVMDLDFTGSARVTSRTEKKNGEHVTATRIAFDDFRVIDPEDGSVAVTGTGLELDAEWNGFSIAGTVPESRVDLELPPARIHDIGMFNAMIPQQASFSLESGTGQVEATLEVDQRVAFGNLDVAADDIVLRTDDTPVFADLEVHAELAKGDLPTKHFDFSGTTIRIDDIVNNMPSEKKQGELEPWYVDVKLRQGEIVFGKPVAVSGRIDLRMFDTRPVTAILGKLGVGPKWLSLAPKIKDVEGATGVQIREGSFAFDDLVMTGKGFETLGWLHVQGKQANGRIFAKFKAVKAGVAIDEGKTKVILSKPRQWFEEQPKGLE